MILGIGIDFVTVQTFADLVSSDPRIIDRVFDDKEKAMAEEARHFITMLALVAALKEAAMKALGTGWSDAVDWLDIHVSVEAGDFQLTLSGGALDRAKELGVRSCRATGHCRAGLALAFALLES